MKLMKRSIALIVVLTLMVGCLGTVYAAGAPNPDSPLASPTLISYSVSLAPGDNCGELDITFDVTAAGWAESLGVSYIEIHKASNDELVDTINGSTSNGLKSSGSVYARTYTYTGATHGVRYYAVVAVFAQIATGANTAIVDSRTLKTSPVTAP